MNYWLKCRYTNGKSYSLACLLSLFFGVFGVDRFYLGYPVIGLIKLSTFGMLGIGALADLLLILLQVCNFKCIRIYNWSIKRVGPSDGSDLIMPYYGFRVNYMWSDENTIDLTNQLWFRMTHIIWVIFYGSLLHSLCSVNSKDKNVLKKKENFRYLEWLLLNRRSSSK